MLMTYKLYALFKKFCRTFPEEGAAESFLCSGSIIFLADFKEALRVSADRADLGRFFAHDQMSAVAALPPGLLGLFENGFHFHVIQPRALAFLV